MNVAADTARLGHRAAFVSAVPDDPLGQLSLDLMASFGVDTSLVKVMPRGHMGITFVEFSAAPRAPRAVYLRRGSSASLLGPEDFDWPAITAQSAVAYTDGIFPGLGEGCLQASLRFLEAARQTGTLTAFDCNYREHIWEPAAARAAWARLLPLVDIVVTNRSVSEQVFGYCGSDAEILSRYAREFGCRVVCGTWRELLGLSRGAWRAMAWESGVVQESRRVEFEIVDRYGTGDAWTAGFIRGYRSGGVKRGLEFASALCALAHTIEGDVVHVTEAEVEDMLRDGVNVRVKR
jgi:2-dehydro-3-deoxygluconokinase